jgi:MFS family permease
MTGASKYTKQSDYNYRAWPLFALGFIRLFYVSIFERALQNYLYFTININASTLGFISSAGAIAYIFAPILGQIITSKYLGIRKALILNCILTPILTGAQIFYSAAWFLLIVRIALGIAMGLYWPNTLTMLSKWQKVSSIEKSKKNFAFFNFSWNSGFIIGISIGFLWAFYWNDYFAMLVSWFLSFALIPISLFLDKEDNHELSEIHVIYQTEDPLTHLDIEEDLTINSQTPMITFSIFFSWICIMFLATSKSILIFGFPVILKAFDDPSYFTYIIQGGLQFFQLLGLTWINSMKVYSRKVASLISIAVISSFALLIVLINNIWLISIITIITGLFLGLIHGVGMKIMLEYGTARNTSKYASINEIIIGIGFGVTPIIAGYIVEVDIFAIYRFTVLLGIVLLFVQIYLSRHLKRI